MKKENKTKIINYICAAMLFVLFITQLLPFWKCSNCKEHKDVDRTVSIAEYVWLPEHHKPITKGMTDVYLEAYGQDYTGENGKKYSFAVDDILVPLVVIFVGSAVGAVLCCVFSKNSLLAIIPAVVGGVGIYWYLSCPAMKVGDNWVLHLIVAIITTLTALAALAYGIRAAVKK